MPRLRLTILVKLILAFVVPTVAAFVVFAVVAHEVARRDLEEELGARVTAVAAAAATHLRERSLAKLEPGSEGDLRYQRCQERLRQVAEASGVIRIYVFDRALTSVCDTADGVPIGVSYYQLERDRHEIDRVFAARARASSILFEGNDGALYKAGYAPVDLGEPGAPVELAVGVDAPAAYFERLGELRRTLAAYGAAFLAIVLAISVIMAALITRPVRALSVAAARIGGGDLDRPIEPSSRDEIGFLARTMDEMRRGIRARDERAQRMLAGIAHEIRNPLGGIELFAGILRDELPHEGDARSHVARIERELEHLKAVVEDFLAYARRAPPELESVPLAPFCNQLLDLLRPDAQTCGVELVAAPDDLAVRADPRQLKRALLNLLRNALQASATAVPPGQVRIAARLDGDQVAVEVANTGPPIPEHARARVFEPFFTTKEKGTGLGLAFVREIAQDHGGAVELARSDERGTAFVLSLPRA